MRKIALFGALLGLIMASGAPIFAQETASSTDPGQSTDLNQNIPRGPFDDIIDGFVKKWITSDRVKTEAQKAMEQAQERIREGANQAVDSAKEAAKAQIQKQAQEQVQEAKTGIAGLVENIKILIKVKMEGIKINIKNFFSNFKFKSKADTF